jgi:hypothetical protein
MTEAEWLTCEDPAPMLEFLRGKASERKLRLFGCACCRRAWHLITDPRSRGAIEVAERFADGAGTGEELATAHRGAAEVALDVWQAPRQGWGVDDTFHAALAAAYTSAFLEAAVWDLLWEESVLGPEGFDSVGIARGASKQMGLSLGFCPPQMLTDGLRAESLKEWTPHANLLGEIFGNPFRPVTFSPSWHADTAVSLARTMYDSRDFSAMPILADALQDASCDNIDILDHCRGPGPHVRGCWVVDLVLGKE